MGFFDFLKGFKKRQGPSYDAASKRKRLKNWKPKSGSANTDIIGSLPQLRSRSRDLVRNNTLAAKAVSTLTNNIVGHGVKVSFKNDPTKGKIQEAWNRWAKQTSCDFDSVFSFYSLQDLIMRSVIESGEVLIRKRINRSKEFPLEYQVLEADFLIDYTSQLGFSSKGSNLNGIELDSQGRVKKYHLYQMHPGII